MKLNYIDYEAVEIPRKQEFKIATGSSSVVRNMIVKIRSEDIVGLGASAPNSVTGETMDSIAQALEDLKAGLLGINLSEVKSIGEWMDDALPGNYAAKAGVDIALHDLLAKSLERSTAQILTQVKECQPTDITLGIESLERTVEEARKGVDEGFKALKIKVGRNLEGDITRVCAVREAVGSNIMLWVDANQGYSVSEAIHFSREISHLGLEFIEQPVVASDLKALGDVRERSPVPIMADEAAKTVEDVKAIIKLGCADMVNIKLMKCGGIYRAREIAQACKDAGLPNMIGCMGETVVSIAGALHFALSEENVRYADLDSHFMLERSIAEGIEFRDGCLWPSSMNGLGIRLKN